VLSASAYLGSSASGNMRMALYADNAGDQTSLGLFDLAIAAPSMKAALQAWGSKTNLFQQGFAKQTDDPAIVAATSPNLASFCGGRSDRMARSANMPSCRRNFPSTR
jgi:hypothetical protein